MAYHLERFAQLALPKTLDMEDEALSDKTGSVHSRRADDRAIVPVIEGSRKNDFDYEEQLTYLDDSASLNDGEASTGGHIALSCEELMRFNSAHVHNDSDTRETGVEKILRWTQETQATNGIPSGRQDVTDAVYRTFLLEPPSIQDETNDGIVDKEDEAVDADEDDEEDEELDFDENDGKLDSGKDDEQLDADDKSKHAIQLEFQGYPPSFTKAGDSWVAYFNQDIPRNLDIELVHDLKDESFVNCVAFSPNGEYLATGSHRMVKIFTVENGKEIASLTDQSFIPVDENVWIMSICYSPDGRFLLTGDQNKTITVGCSEPINKIT